MRSVLSWLWCRPLGRAVLVLANLLALSTLYFRWNEHGPFLFLTPIDVDVYRLGAQVWLDGGDMYGPLPLTQAGVELPFTYPPLAAVLFTPLTVISWSTAGFVMTSVTVLLTALVLAALLSHYGVRAPGRVPWALLAVLPLALVTDPVRGTAGFGQVNLVLMALVVLDCLARSPRWPRGLLVGVAAAVKLTPAVFLLYFLLDRDRRAAVTTLLSFAGATALGFALAWRDSVKYWTVTLFDTNRIGEPSYPGNQSIKGLLARLGLTGTALTVVWLLLCLGVLLVVLRAMRAAAGGPGGAPWVLSLNALAGLLVSPVSWSHHWVWVVPAGFCLVLLGVRTRDRLALGLAAVLAFTAWAATNWWYSFHAHLGWNPLQTVLGNAYVLVAVAILVAAPRLFVTQRGSDRGLDAADRAKPQSVGR
ncbi:alpha-1,2-mannosyltransferase [Crossiella equi]|uniref:Alpha-1,2-mannosyltransferase n=1 Tax=Crossiella equi TaxID=130796 RepID=A0ABS5A9H6_9PSEU|nr:glycosyltransferase 87 family protein [Crossiella equi]MBP2472869.1 alpha-1,2-mannosyltransferase [Crossiella equi]